jgi:hypothetical protein
MNGYLQRIAISALKPGGSIQPILGSLFSPPDCAIEPKPPSMETARPVTPARLTELVPRAEPRVSLDAPGPNALPAPKPSPESLQSDDGVKIPGPIPNWLFTPLIPRPNEKGESLIADLQPAKSSTHGENGARKPPRETTAATPPYQKVNDHEGAMAPGMPMVAAGTAARPGDDSPGAQRATSRELVTAETSKKSGIDAPRTEPASGKAFVAVETSTRRVFDSPGAELAIKRVRAMDRTSASPIVHSPGAEGATRAIPAKRDFRKLVATTPSPFAAGVEGKPRILPRSAHPARPEPDDIQIHIGRIEVVALPMAPATQAEHKSRRNTPSLDEYLRRRDGKSV